MSDELQNSPEDSSNQNNDPNTSKKPLKKYHLGIEQALEDEIGLEVEHGQLSEDELNSGNDI